MSRTRYWITSLAFIGGLLALSAREFLLAGLCAAVVAVDVIAQVVEEVREARRSAWRPDDSESQEPPSNYVWSEGTFAPPDDGPTKPEGPTGSS